MQLHLLFINPEGSRFSDGSYGVLYLADTIETAIDETRYHQQRYLQQISGLHYDTIIMRSFKVTFSGGLVDLPHSADESIYHPQDYLLSQKLAVQLRSVNNNGLQYLSVRNQGALCWALFTPKCVERIYQCAHYEYIDNGKKVSDIRKISSIR